MTYQEYNKTVKQEFLYHGFISIPLSDKQIEECYDLGIDTHTIYSIGCDVGAGFAFDTTEYIT